MFRIIFAAFFCLFSSSAVAQDSSRTILVLDASGSMWGQIDGKAKITIAQEVVGDLLQNLSAEQQLGLTIYGHRQKGSCTDIETVIAPGPNQRSAIADAVNAIKPKGKTPMTDAVIAAAQELRFTEEKATVILVSDGVETCHPDPCQAARLLEETGVDFTAHVVGFAIDDPIAIGQMQCLADETGGTFRTASNAAELGDALKVVSEPAPEPEPVPVLVNIHATDGKRGPKIDDELVWDLASTDAVILETELTDSLSLELAKGEYTVSVLRPADEATAELRFGVGSVGKQVVLELPEFRPPATLEAPATAVAGSTIQVRWTGPDKQSDVISVAEPGTRGSNFATYSYTKEGMLLDLVVPAEPGEYEIRYVLSDGRKILARQKLEVTPVVASLNPPDALPAGATVDVEWTGPDYRQDIIAVTKRGADNYRNYSYTKNGSPLGVEMPTEPGDYDMIYMMSLGRTIIARVPITVTDISISISTPETATAGDTIQVDWVGPDYQNDVISVAEIGTRGSKMLGYTYTREGSPLGLEMPLEPGRYEIRYVLGQGREIEATSEIEVTAVSAELHAPQEADAGSALQVGWTGPDYQGDVIAITTAGQKATHQMKYTYTKESSPLEIDMPAEPGDYVLRYVASGPPRTVLAEQVIRINDVSASLVAPATAAAGSEIEVTWDGPGDDRDFIAIGQPGKNYKTYSYAREGSPLMVKVPDETGPWEIRYIMRVDKRVLATIPLTVE